MAFLHRWQDCQTQQEDQPEQVHPPDTALFFFAHATTAPVRQGLLPRPVRARVPPREQCISLLARTVNAECSRVVGQFEFSHAVILRKRSPSLREGLPTKDPCIPWR